MTTPDFEEWLSRQDFEVMDTADKETFISMLQEELGLTGGTLDVAEEWYDATIKGFPAVGISSFEWRDTTRYAIEGYRGAFGLQRAAEIGIQRATEQGLLELAEWIGKVAAALLP